MSKSKTQMTNDGVRNLSPRTKYTETFHEHGQRTRTLSGMGFGQQALEF